MNEEKPQAENEPASRKKPGRWKNFGWLWLRNPFYAVLRLLLLTLILSGLLGYLFYRANREDVILLLNHLARIQTDRLFAEQATFTRMEMPSFGHFIFRDFRIADPFVPQRDFLTARRVEVQVDPLRLIWRGINLSRVELQDADVWIHHDSLADKYNIESIFKSRQPSGEPSSEQDPGQRVRIRDMRLENVRVKIEDVDRLPFDNQVDYLEGTFTRIGGENLIEVRQSHISTTYRNTGQVAVTGIVSFTGDYLGLQNTRVVKGQTDLTGSGWFKFDQRTYLYQVRPGRLELRHLPRELELDSLLTGTVNLTASFSGTFDSTYISAKIGLDSGVLFEYPVRELSTNMVYTAGRLSFTDVDSKVAGGSIHGGIEFRFNPGEAGYHSTMEARGIDLARLRFDWSRGLRGRLSGSMDLSGSGYSDPDLQLDISGRSVQGLMFGERIDSAQVDYSYNDKKSRVDNLALYSQGAMATAIGDIRTDTLFLFVLVENLPAVRATQWLPVFDGLTGRVEFSGSLNGLIEDPNLNGTYTVEDGSYEEMTFSRLEGDCELIGLRTVVRGKADLQLTDVGLFDRLYRSLRISATIPDTGAIRFDPLELVQDSLNQLRGVGWYSSGKPGEADRVWLDSLEVLYAGRRAVALDTVHVWRLADTTSIGGIRLSVLDGAVEGDLRLIDSGWLESSARFRGLDLARLPESLRPDFPLSGLLRGDLRLSGTLDRPSGTVSLQVDKPVFSLLNLDRLSGRLSMEGEDVLIDTLELSVGGKLSTLSGRIPLNVVKADSLGPAPPRELSLHARLNSFPLTAIQSQNLPFSAGQIDGEMDIRGTEQKPLLSGQLSLSGGQGLIAPINTRLQNMSGRLVLQPGSLRLEQLVSQSPEGKLQISGRVPLDGFRPDSLEITVRGRDMVLQQFKNVTSLRVNVDLSLTGPLEQLLLNGNVKVIEGEVSPAFSAVTGTEGTTDAQSQEELQLPVLPFNYDVQFTAQDNFWLRNRNAGIKLSANIRASQIDSSASIRGQVTTVAGYYSVFGRRFQVKYGSIQFQGRPTIDPLLDINAERTVSGRILRSDVVGSAYGLQSTPGTTLPGEQYEMDRNTFILHIGGTMNNPQFEINVEDKDGQVIEPPITPEMARTLVLVDQTYLEFQQQSGMSQSKLLDQAANIALNQANPYLQEWTGLDEFSIESQLFTRSSGAAEDQSNDKASAKLTMGEFLFEKVFFSFSQDLVDPTARSAQIEYLINRNSSIIGQTDSKGHFSVDYRYLIKY